MSLFDIQEIKTLADSSGGPHLSIYMPAVKAGPETRQNSIRFKNLLDQASDQLHESGLSPDEINRLLNQANQLRADNVFWQQQNEGLVVLINEHDTHVYQLPREFPEEARVNDRFYLTPLMQFLYEGGDFYILALSQNNVRLLKGTPYTIEEVPLEGVASSIEDSLPYEDPERHFNWHPRSANPGTNVPGQRPGMFYGHGSGDDEAANNDILRYFKNLNKGVTNLLKDSRSPLVLAGVDYLLPIYKEANSYPHLVEEAITQHPKSFQEKELQQEAWKIVKPIFDEAKNEIIGRYSLLKGRNEHIATDDLKEVITAAPFGRVEVLFVDKNAQRWGSFDEQQHEVKFSDNDQPGSQDLIEFAALETLRNGGIVYAVEPGELPGEAHDVAAILRY
jgi:hypothetical protein